MNINDALLVKMIEKDMKARNVAETNYIIAEDKVVNMPTEIRVESNQAVYLCYFKTRTLRTFSVTLVSGTSQVRYNPETTTKDNIDNYESTMITPHFSTINIRSRNSDSFLVRYIKVVFDRNNQNNQNNQ